MYTGTKEIEDEEFKGIQLVLEQRTVSLADGEAVSSWGAGVGGGEPAGFLPLEDAKSKELEQATARAQEGLQAARHLCIHVYIYIYIDNM